MLRPNRVVRPSHATDDGMSIELAEVSERAEFWEFGAVREISVIVPVIAPPDLASARRTAISRSPPLTAAMCAFSPSG